MKYLIFSILLLMLLSGFCLWAGQIVETAVETTETLLTQALQEIQNGNAMNAYALAEQAASQWKTNQRLFGILLEHDETSEVQREFVELLSMEPSGHLHDFDHICEVLLEKIQHIKEQDKARIENIL